MAEDSVAKTIVFLLRWDKWEALESADNWLFVYDRMPKQMRRIIDLKITGVSNKAIARKLRCSVNNIYNHLLKAKKRILRGENIL